MEGNIERNNKTNTPTQKEWRQKTNKNMLKERNRNRNRGKSIKDTELRKDNVNTLNNF